MNRPCRLLRPYSHVGPCYMKLIDLDLLDWFIMTYIRMVQYNIYKSMMFCIINTHNSHNPIHRSPIGNLPVPANDRFLLQNCIHMNSFAKKNKIICKLVRITEGIQ